MGRTIEGKRAAKLSNEQKRDVLVDIPPTKPRLPPFRPSESLVDDPLASSGQNAGIVSHSQSSDNVQPRLSWTPPACFTYDYRYARSEIRIVDINDLQEYLQEDLDMNCLRGMEKYLWWASLSHYSVALHEHCLEGCSIVLTEQHTEHEVRKSKTLFVKPLPEYLLSYSVWDSYLCKDDRLYANAMGLLRSYLLLIRTKSDIIIAHEKSLVPKEITWQQWASFARVALPNCHLESCNPRYWYGLLDEVRLTWIWRLTPESFRINDWSRYITSTYDSSSFIQENTKWLLGTLLYITIVLTAMQVGLATDRLNSSVAFSNASSGFTIFSILAPLAILLGVIFLALLQESGFLIDRYKMFYGDRAKPKSALNRRSVSHAVHAEFRCENLSD